MGEVGETTAPPPSFLLFMGRAGDRAERGVGVERGRGSGESYVPLSLGMLESQWLQLLIKAQLVKATEMAVLKEKKEK